MPNWSSSLPIERVRTLAAVSAVVSALVIALLLPFGARGRGRRQAVLGAAITGSSEDGTCSIRSGSEFPAESGSIVDVSGELAPRNGPAAKTVDRGSARSARSARMPATAPCGGTTVRTDTPPRPAHDRRTASQGLVRPPQRPVRRRGLPS